MDQKSFADQSYARRLGTNDKVDAFRKQLHAILKAKGFIRETGNQSALYHWEYTRGTRRIAINGWHGTGKPGTNRFWGHEKSFFTLIDSITGFNVAVECPNSADSLEWLLTTHDQKMAEALQYVRSL